jgi:hypothetical protein
VLTHLFTLTKEMVEGARTTHNAETDARAMVARLEKMQGADIDAFKAKVESLAPAPVGGGGGRGGRGGGGRGGAGAAATATAPTLESVSASLLSAAMAMQSAEVAPTAVQVAACVKARVEMARVMAKWSALKTALTRRLQREP